jgi:putative ABC transport system permease protein
MPPSFRRRYGDEMLEFYMERFRSAETPARLWTRVIADLLTTIAIEWLRAIGTREVVPPTVIHRKLSTEERMSVLGQEIVHSIRSLRKSVAFSTAAVVTLALGIASTTAIFSIVESVLLRPLPFPEADRIVVPETQDAGAPPFTSVSYADFMDWRDNHVFDKVAVFYTTQMDLTGAGEPVRVPSVAVGPQFFGALGVRPASGRLLADYDYPVTAGRAVVISDRLWRTQFGGRPDIIGTEVEVNSIKRPIVGVLPPDARWPLVSDLYVPFRLSTENDPDLKRRDNLVYEAIARMKPGATLASTRAAMAQLAARVAKEEPLIRKNITTLPVPVMQSLLGSTTPRALWILLGSVSLLLLIGCVNVANLQLARATARQRELAVRTALGASGFRLVRQTLIESGVLGLTGGVLGVILAQWIVKAMVAMAPADVPRVEMAALSIPAVGFAFAVSLVVALLFGLMPALQASRSDPHLAMGEGARGSSGGRSTRRARRSLVVIELALSVVLLVGAGLALRSVQRLRGVQAGFETHSVLTASISLPGVRYQTGAAVVQFMYNLRDRLAQAPGIRGAGIASASPLGAGGFYLGRSMAMEGKAPTPENEISMQWNAATPGYFAALGLPIRGRDFTAQDDTASSPVMIVNETFARRMFGSADPIGKRAMSTRDEKVYRQIIGVVPNMRYSGVRDTATALAWVPYAQRNAWSQGIITVRTDGAAESGIATLRNTVKAMDPNIALANIATMDHAAAVSIASDRMVAVLLGSFAALALILAAVGIFGVLSYTVAQRTRELGVRMALGAQKRDVLGLVFLETMPLVATGVVIGIGVGLVMSRLMASMLFEVPATDPVTFVGVALVLSLVGLAAALFPARRAARIDPVIALRSD